MHRSHYESPKAHEAPAVDRRGCQPALLAIYAQGACHQGSLYLKCSRKILTFMLVVFFRLQKQIDVLIEKEYLKRPEESRDEYEYLA